MASSSTKSTQSTPIPEYFTKLSSIYARQTGNSTYNIIVQALKEIPTAITPSSILHDNACGPGTASIAAISHLGQEPAKIEATDSVPAMIDAVSSRISTDRLEKTTATLMDSLNLKFADGTFTTSICNISVANFTEPPKALREVHRTLQRDGLAIVTVWKRFTVADLIHTAQRAVRPDAELMKIPKAELMQEGYLRDMMVGAGFEQDRVEQRVVSTTVTGEDVEGLREFMLGGFTAPAREDWTREEQEKWPCVINQAIEEEMAMHGGIKMDAWVVYARK